MRQRPLVMLALSLAAGVVLRVELATVAGPAVAWLGVALAAAVGVTAAVASRRPGASWVALAGLVTMAGFLYAGARLAADRGDVPAWEGNTVTLVGTVVRQPDVGEGRASYILAVRSIDGRPARGKAQLVRYRRPGHLDLGGSKSGESGFDLGDVLRVRGRLERPRTAGNPGEFDYAAYLARQGVYARMAVWEREGAPEAASGATPEVIGHAWTNPLQRAALRTRRAFEGVLRRTLPPAKAALLSGLLFGTRGDLPPEIAKDFRDAGVYHILAVSGSNVAFIALPTLGLARRLRFTRRGAAVVTALVVVFYVYLTGASPSVVRAGVMAVVALGPGVFGRRGDSCTSLAAAGMLLLVANPLSLFDAGFQLSFGATLGILALYRPIRERLGRLPAWLAAGLAVTVAAQLAVLPISLYYFNGISLVSLVANLAVIPLVGALVYLGTAACLAGLVWLGPAWVINLVSSLLLGILTGSMALLARLPYAYLYLAPFSALATGAYYLLVLGAVGPWRPTWLPSLGTRRAAALGVLLVGAVLVWNRALGDPPGTLTVTFLDVGQGDSVFVQTPGGRTVLIDGGGRPEYSPGPGAQDGGGREGFDPGERVVVPFLRRAGVRRLDYVVLTHPHGDHVGGLVAVLENFPVTEVLDSAQPRELPEYQHFLALVRERGAGYRIAREGERLPLDGRLDMQVLHPARELMTGTRSDPNSNSVIIRLVYGEVGFLFSGDAEREAEQGLVQRYGGGLRSTVLKIPHHGSDYGTTDAFLEAVRPRLAVIEVGRNSFGHPGSETLSRLDAHGISTCRTDRDGAVIVKTDGRILVWRAFRREGRSASGGGIAPGLAE